MSAATSPAPAASGRARMLPLAAARRLLRLEVRHSVMLWMVPLAAALFWFSAYRQSMAMPPLWHMRAMTMQHGVLLAFITPVVGAAAWMGWRDRRRGMTDLVTAVARPRWARQLATWAAVTGWALAAYAACVGALYVAIGQHAAGGGPLWWPAAVGAAGIPAISAIGFAAGAFLPSRFTTPLVTVAAFFGLGISEPLAHGGHSYGQISPLIAGAVDVGPDPGVATFYHYLPDLSIAQVMFLAGLAVATLGILGLPAGSGGRWLRRSAAAVTAAGLVAAGTAVALVGTARLDAHGMMTIPALHDAASDRPIRYVPVCSATAIPVCLNPVYAAYLPVVTAALQPVVSQVAGLPGAPARISQAAPTYRQEGLNGVSIGGAGLLVLTPLPGRSSPQVPTAQFAAMVRQDSGAALLASVILARPGPGRADPGPAQQAVLVALLRLSRAERPGGERGGPPPPGPAVDAAARRFAALPPATRHAWLVRHLAALRAGRISLARLP
jgi:hypothetical protein